MQLLRFWRKSETMSAWLAFESKVRQFLGPTEISDLIQAIMVAVNEYIKGAIDEKAIGKIATRVCREIYNAHALDIEMNKHILGIDDFEKWCVDTLARAIFEKASIMGGAYKSLVKRVIKEESSGTSKSELSLL